MHKINKYEDFHVKQKVFVPFFRLYFIFVNKFIQDVKQKKITVRNTKIKKRVTSE